MTHRSPRLKPRPTAWALVATAPTDRQPALTAAWLAITALAVGLGAALTGIVIAVR
jgi:hypothetical protein